MVASRKWTKLDPPTALRPPVAVRGMPGLARSEEDSFPLTVPYASQSITRITPTKRCESPSEAGKLAREIMEEELIEHPVLVLQGLPVHSRQDFSEFFAGVGLARHGYEGGVGLRDDFRDGVSYASTEPPEVVISPHNENAYMPNPPAIVMFHCLEAARSGGEIPINDVRKIPAQLPGEFVQQMRKRGMRYIRRVPRKNALLENGWEQQFSTTEQSVVEAYLEGQQIAYHWEADEVLRFWFERSVFREYRGEEIWFNQLSESNAEWWLCHPVFKALGTPREMIQSDTAYGDGEPFTPAVTAMVRGALWQTTELVRLEPSDIIILDNYLSQHGRLAYEGSRQHHVALIKDPLS